MQQDPFAVGYENTYARHVESPRSRPNDTVVDHSTETGVVVDQDDSLVGPKELQERQILEDERQRKKQVIRSWVEQQQVVALDKAEELGVQEMLPVGCLEESVSFMELVTRVGGLMIDVWIAVKTANLRRNLYLRPVKRITRFLVDHLGEDSTREEDLPIFRRK
ncbi:MAG: hypothetical protein KVP17_002278 [Porospora cf. gigantea B]|uniref:uncharacterized protein n=1 Tax=Porospora cf. gigantea B TaxID=2853592 RepID=UPI003571C510|nr:MAG: hypothetical protein KVP17_002278 [Porospora cf. gigantea B]